ncbi:DUF5134 domain-containing protein [Arthrobacter sp. UYEF20]|uniref:DUF5134 domain-containing protein n=1 Tax=Arthrobacter sp. UYEF20 TaxID=1756363 RepID=UPI00339B5E6D
MIENEFLRLGLTALLLAASLYAAFRASRKSPPATRVGFGLHAAMMSAMVLMLAPGLQGPALPQIFFFGLAAWWFVLRAVSRRPLPVACQGRARRAGATGMGGLLYNALTMAAMAYMLAATDVRGAHGALAGLGAAGLPGQSAHHGGPAAGPLPPGSRPGYLPGWSSQSALVLAAAFGVAGAVWGLLLLRRLRPQARRGRGDAFLELVGAASMAVMFAALAV